VPFNNKEGERVTCGNVVRKTVRNGTELKCTDVFDILEEITTGITEVTLTVTLKHYCDSNNTWKTYALEDTVEDRNFREPVYSLRCKYYLLDHEGPLLGKDWFSEGWYKRLDDDTSSALKEKCAQNN
jgi:hypothetical protein